MVLFVIGRIIVGGFYLYNASNHVLNLDDQTSYARSKGVPAPRAGVLVGGLLLFIGGFTLLTGLWPTVGIIAVVIFFVSVTPVMHAFWEEEDPQAQQMEMINFVKNTALLGSTLMFVAIPQPWPVSLGG